MAADLDTPRSTCYALFNNRHFAAVTLAAYQLATSHPPTPITVRDLAASLKVADSVVRPVVLRLADAGLLADDPKRTGRGSRQFTVIAPPRWDALVAVIEGAGLHLPAHNPS